MTTSIVLSLDARRPKVDGTCPIVLRITHHKKVAQINTGYFAKQTDWNSDARCLKSSFKGTESVTRLNNLLTKKKTEATDIISRLDERKTLNGYSVAQLKQLIEKKADSESFFAYGQKLIVQQKEANRIGNARTYEHAITAFKKFNGGRDLKFFELNLDFLNRFEVNHLKKGKTYNGLGVYLRAIRAIYNQAIKAKIVDKELYPFADYEIKRSKTRKRAISPASIKAIEDKQLPVDHPLFQTRAYFLFSFYTRGMSFADMAELQLSNLINGRIYYERKKTGTLYDVKITQKLQGILDYFTAGKERSDYVFPIIKRQSAEDQYRDIEWARLRFNKKLKKLGKECNIQENLTSYVSRHSFATIAKNMGIATASISDMLGHGDIKTTQVYLDSLPSEQLDNLHEMIINKTQPSKDS